MKRQKLWLLLGLAIAMFGTTGCTGSTVTIVHFEGESCESNEQCSAGLLCDSRICRKVCNGEEDCNPDQQCLESRCVPRGGTVQAKDLPEGSSCDNTRTCSSELVCIHDVCSKVDCQNDADCHDENKECKNYKCVAKPELGKLGESCSDSALCDKGLTCSDGTCKLNCSTNDDCATIDCGNNSDCKSIYICMNSICIVNTNIVPDSPKVPEGGTLLPIATTVTGTTSNGETMTVKVFSGAIQGQYSKDGLNVQVKDGTWRGPQGE